jgi:hypothetical protein
LKLHVLCVLPPFPTFFHSPPLSLSPSNNIFSNWSFLATCYTHITKRKECAVKICVWLRERAGTHDTQPMGFSKPLPCCLNCDLPYSCCSIAVHTLLLLIADSVIFLIHDLLCCCRISCSLDRHHPTMIVAQETISSSFDFLTH